MTFAFGALVEADLGELVRVQRGLDIPARCRRPLPIPGGGPAPPDDTCLTIIIGGEILGVTADGPAEVAACLMLFAESVAKVHSLSVPRARP